MNTPVIDYINSVFGDGNRLREKPKVLLTAVTSYGKMKSGRLRARRVMYAASEPSGLVLPGPDEHAVRTGRAELPEGARVTERDKRIARNAPPIAEPTSEDDIPRFLAQLHVDDLHGNVMEKMVALAKDSPGGDVYNWTLGKYLGHKNAMETLGRYHVLDWPNVRRLMHNNAIVKTVNPNARVPEIAGPREQKHFVLLMGSPGSGKSTYGTRFTKDYIQKHYTEINPDLVREFFKEYQGHNEAGTHRESQLLTFGPMIQHAYKHNHHIVLNVTGADFNQMSSMLTAARGSGYKTHLVYVDRDPYRSIGGTWKRFQVNPYGAKDPNKPPSRFVLTKYTLGIAKKPKETYERLKTSHLLDTFDAIEPPEKYNKNGEGYKLIPGESSHARKRI